jgi:hypothetical protein
MPDAVVMKISSIASHNLDRSCSFLLHALTVEYDCVEIHSAGTGILQSKMGLYIITERIICVKDVAIDVDGLAKRDPQVCRNPQANFAAVITFTLPTRAQWVHPQEA